MPIEIRRVREEELPAFIDALSTSFLERPDVARLASEVVQLWDLDRTWAALDEGRVCGTFRSWATELTVPGLARLPAAAVAAVSVRPTHRRRGILRQMVAADHAAARERGEALALLYASEYPIYGRFGYGSAVRWATWTVDTHRTGFHGEPVGGVSIESIDEALRDELRAVFERWRLQQPGEIRRRDFRWNFDLGLREEPWGPKRWKGFVAVHRDAAGAIDGYARYRAEQKFEQGQPRGTIELDDLHALTDDAYAALWRLLAETDWVATIKAEGRSPSERLPWLLTNPRAARVEEVLDGLWVRIFDVPRALAARSYERAGRLVIEVVDEEAPGGRTRYALEATPDGATCRATDESAELTVHVSALGAAYLGGVRLRDAVLARGLEEHRPGALAEADSLFRTAEEPVCTTFF